ncbi:hypothetical protein F66182_7816 [Fusarium sp. NRRL 66182]|nr:hypothetical protein F66182_7816 [Fusarium sp. NRRL 66182]
MSGAEAAAAFGLAAGIIQVIGFSLQLWDTTAHIRKTGSTVTTADCTREAEILGKQCDEVRRLKSVETHLEESSRIDEIATEALAIIGDIAHRLEKCQVPPESKGYTWFEDVIVHVLWNGQRADVEALKKKLEQLRNELQFQVVISIKQKVDVLDLQRTEEFEKLGQNLQGLVNALFAGDETVKSQLQYLRQQQDEIRQGIQGLFIRSNQRGAVPRDREEVLRELQNRLWFNAIPHRHDAITEAHSKTFEWVFTEQETAETSNSTFVEWMRNGQGLYWVSGRAGTGKSSLMRFLNDDPRTISAFTEWAGDRPLVIAPFYFWNNPDASIDIRLCRLEGIYQGLLYKILEAAPELLELLFPNHTGGRDWGSFPTLFDLRQAFTRLLRADTLPVAIALMIDGLDEYDASQGDQIALANMLKDAAAKPHLKVLVSSRPEFAFENCMGLKLDQLTEVDRKIYVTDSFTDNARFDRLEASPEEKTALITLVVEKSEGIFLWARIVVLALQEELYVAKSIQTLNKLVDEAPSGKRNLSDLFGHMLFKRIRPEFRLRGFRLIWVLQQCLALPTTFMPRPNELVTPYLATGLLFSFLEDEIACVKAEPLKAAQRQRRLDQTALELQRYCAGLLEMRSVPDRFVNSDDRVVDYEVHYLHKDVAIFLKDEKQQAVLDETLDPVQMELTPKLMECFVMFIKTYDIKPDTETRYRQSVPWWLAEATMRLARVTEEYSINRTEVALDQLDEAMSRHLSSIKRMPDSIKAKGGKNHWAGFFPFDGIHKASYYPWPKPDDGFKQDFLSFAIQHGLFHYVKVKLRKKPATLKRKGLPLLSSACAPVPQWWLLTPNPMQSRTVKLLLDLGANPNEEFRGTSPWQMTLLVALDSMILTVSELEELAKILRLLLEHEADALAPVKWSSNVELPDLTLKVMEHQRSSDEQIKIAFVDRFTGESLDGPPLLGAAWHDWRQIRSHLPEEGEISSEERSRLLAIGNDLLELCQRKMREQEMGVSVARPSMEFAPRYRKVRRVFEKVSKIHKRMR